MLKEIKNFSKFSIFNYGVKPTQLKAEYESKMEAAREETAETRANFEAQLELTQSESEKIKAEYEAKVLEHQQASTDAQSLNAASLQEAILEQKKHAEKMVYIHKINL